MTYIDWSKIGAVTVKRYNGIMKTYGSLSEAFRHRNLRLGYSKANIYGHFQNVGWNSFTREYYRYGIGDEYIIRDEYGLVIPRWRIVEEAVKTTPWLFSTMRVSYRFGVKGYEPHGPYWRNGPVFERKLRKPGKHHGYGKCKARKHYGRRRERSQQERSIAYLMLVDEEMLEYGIKVRGNRGLERMDWDRRRRDKPANWKRYRKTQYKVVVHD